MPRRELLTSTERLQLLAFPEDEGELIRLATLTRDDLAFVRQHRGDHNRLGIAVLMVYLRFSGRVLSADERPVGVLVNLIAEQIEVSTTAWGEHAKLWGGISWRHEMDSEAYCRRAVVSGCLKRYFEARSGHLDHAGQTIQHRPERRCLGAGSATLAYSTARWTATHNRHARCAQSDRADLTLFKHPLSSTLSISKLGSLNFASIR